jgi:alpha-L-fucosidase 2
MKGAVQFFLDFLIDDPQGKYLVTNPSTSPENPPKGPGYEYFLDEVTGSWYFTTICYGASIDIQILTDLFGYYLETEKALGLNTDFAAEVAAKRKRLAPPQIGRDGTLQEWTEDFEQMEPNHRHNSHLYGLYPGNVISAKRTPEFVDGVKKVLELRGDGASGWSRVWKMALWSRLYDGNRANRIFKGYLKEQCYPQFFAKCGTPLQIDGTMGASAAITEMLVQSHEGVIDLLPALPDEWANGKFDGVCTRGNFELDMRWENSELSEVKVLSKSGNVCRFDAKGKCKITKDGKTVASKTNTDGSIEFKTVKGGVYNIVRK